MEFLQVCACFHGAIVQRLVNFHSFTARVAEITHPILKCVSVLICSVNCYALIKLDIVSDVTIVN